MTDHLKVYSYYIDQALKNKDFGTLFDIFTSNSFSSTELLVFYKRKKEVLSSSIFWVSQLPHFHLKDILDSDLKVDFIQSYLKANANCNHELNRHLFSIAKADCIKFVKLWQTFNHSSFYGSLKMLAGTDSELERTLREFDIIIKAQKQIEDEAKADEPYFLQFSFGEIALAFSLYYYNFKQQDQIAGNKSLQIKIEMVLVEELTNIISLLKGKTNMVLQFSGNDELQKDFQRNEAPHHLLGKKGLNIPLEPKFKLLYDLIDRLIDRNFYKGQIQLYLSGYSDFMSVTLNPSPLRTNDSYRTFKINDAKSEPEELYFSNLRLGSSNVKSPSKTDITIDLETLKFYSIPETINHKGNHIELKKALQLLKHFSIFKGPVERCFFPDGSVMIMNQGDLSFRELFGSNESITIFDSDILSKSIAKYFGWAAEETNSILSFLTLDVTAKSFPVKWINKPFIKFNNQVLWLGSFLKDRRWGNILLNKLKRDSEYQSSVNAFAKNFELRIEELFKSKSFKTVCGQHYTSSNGQTGGFDVLAFKDNHLFVCEAKTGIRSNEFVHAAKSEAVTLEGMAAEQLEKAVFNIMEDWANIKARLEVDVQIDAVKIIPLIITDHFEGDLRIYKNTILKTTLLELDVILKNKKRKLFEMYLFLKSASDSLNPSLKDVSNLIPNWDLWHGKKECDAETLIQNIEQNAVWKEIETVWEFEDESFLIG